MMRGSQRPLSELEGVCLGIVFRHQPCTAYQVRSELRTAPSSHWRASAGSVYPLLARLERDGLLATTSDANDGRGRKHLNITSSGKAALRTWVLAGADPDLVSSLTDPVRSRTFFLDVLAGTRQLAFLDQLIAELDSYLAATRTHLAEVSAGADLYDYLGSLGAVRITAARLGWLREVRGRLSAGK